MYTRPCLCLAAAFLLTMLSCGKSDTPEPSITPVDSLNMKFLVHTSSSFFTVTTAPGSITPGTLPITAFTYGNNRVLTRSGGVITIATSSGYSFIYTPLIYDTVVYNGNNVTITSHYRGTDITVSPDQRDLLLESGRLQRIVKAPDTVYFSYTSSHQLVKAETFGKNDIITRNFIFDSKGNLQQVTSTDKRRNGGSTEMHEKITFSGYDNKPNPFKGLWMWEDLYYRSLSANNFAAYSYEQQTIQDQQVIAVTTQQTNLTLYYNSNGTLDWTR